MSDFYPHFVHPPQPPKGNTITTNRITPDKIHQGTITTQDITTTEEPSNWTFAAVAFLILGFISIGLGLFFPSILLYATIIGGSLILAANTLAILSLRELSS